MASVLCRPAWLLCEGILFAALAGCAAGTDTIASMPGGYRNAQMIFLSPLPPFARPIAPAPPRTPPSVAFR